MKNNNSVASSDATLEITSTVKGVTLGATGLGIPVASLSDGVLGDIGTVTLSAEEAADTSNVVPFVTLFAATNPGATVRVVLYRDGELSDVPTAADYEAHEVYNGTDAVSDKDAFIIRVTAQDAVTVLYYGIVVKIPSDNATLQQTSTIKGVTLGAEGLGTPVAAIADFGQETAGALTLTSAQAVNASLVTLFVPTDPSATVRVAKYAMADILSNGLPSDADFEIHAIYNDADQISNYDVFLTKVTAADNTTVLYYAVVVTVTQPSDVATVTSAVYKISVGGTTISNVAPGTSKAAFEAAVLPGDANQIRDFTGISDPVLNGETLLVTSESGNVHMTYTVVLGLLPTYSVGDVDIASGGTIFYDQHNYTGGWRYLEAAPADLAISTQPWSVIIDQAIGTTGTDIGTGYANTLAIIAQMNSIQVQHISFDMIPDSGAWLMSYNGITASSGYNYDYTDANGIQQPLRAIDPTLANISVVNNGNYTDGFDVEMIGVTAPALFVALPVVGNVLSTSGIPVTITVSVTPPNSVAYQCQQLTTGSYNDWFLPSKDELSHMAAIMNSCMGGGWYWSSSEYNANADGVWFSQFNTFPPLPLDVGYKGASNTCARCIRAF